MQVAQRVFGSEGAATKEDEVMGLEIDPSGGSISTSLDKRECLIL